MELAQSSSKTAALALKTRARAAMSFTPSLRLPAKTSEIVDSATPVEAATAFRARACVSIKHSSISAPEGGGIECRSASNRECYRSSLVSRPVLSPSRSTGTPIRSSIDRYKLLSG